MQIIDSHVHFWHPQQLRYAWLDDEHVLNRPFLPEHLRAASQTQNISGIVFVQADCAVQQGLDEVKWVTQLASEAPIYAIVAFAPLEHGERAREYLQALSQYPLVKGVRRLIQSEAAGFARQPDFIAGVKLLAEYGLSFDLCIRHHQLNDVLELVDQCPEVAFVLDHMGKPAIASRDILTWQESIRRLAAYPQVFCKLSGLVTEAMPELATVEELLPYINHALDVFGVERVMFGSDYPVLTLVTTYSRWIDMAQQMLAHLPSDERQRIFFDNAAAYYRIATE